MLTAAIQRQSPLLMSVPISPKTASIFSSHHRVHQYLHVADGCADADILIHRQHALNRGKCLVAVADAHALSFRLPVMSARILWSAGFFRRIAISPLFSVFHTRPYEENAPNLPDYRRF